MGLKTDVFHYIVALNAKQRKDQAHSAPKGDFESEVETLREGHDGRPGETANAHNLIEREIFRVPQPFVLKTEQKGIKMPILNQKPPFPGLSHCIYRHLIRNLAIRISTCRMHPCIHIDKIQHLPRLE